MDIDEDSEDEEEGAKWDVTPPRGSSSGPNTGPLKNLAYRPRFAASRLAVARSDRRPASMVVALGVVLPDVVVEVGVPEMGRRLERMPVVVRRRSRGSDLGSVGSWKTG